MGKKLLPFLIYSNLFIASCALLLTIETFCLLHLPASMNWYLLLMFLSALFVYSLHYFVKSKKEKTDSRLDWCRKNDKLLLTIIVCSFIFIAGGILWHYQSIFMKTGHFNYVNLTWFIIISGVAFGYSYPLNPWNKKSLRQVGWLKMASLSFTWSFTTTVLPVLLLPEQLYSHPGNNQMVALFLHRFFFIAALSFLFNINDYEEDIKDGIKTIAVLLGPGKSIQYGKWIMCLANAGTAALLLYIFHMNHPVYYAALLLPVVLLFLLYQRFTSQKDELAFVIRNDGLMIVKALLLIFAVLTTSS
jgi:4-hydroxybenzoate polyprenyltransferase